MTSELRNRPRANRLPAAVVLLAALGAPSCTTAPWSRPQSAASAGRADTAARRALDAVTTAARLAPLSERIWPGFRLSSQVLFAVASDTGPLFLTGDEAPGRGYVRVSRNPLVFVRRGAPPARMRGLVVDGHWGWLWARRPLTGGALDARTLIHEAFHTHQARRRSRAGEFWGSEGPTFPLDSVEALAILFTEAEYLAQAIDAVPGPARDRALATALALEQRLCRLLRARVCDEVRSVEQIEGSAEYVAYALLKAGGIHGDATLRDSLRIHLRGELPTAVTSRIPAVMADSVRARHTLMTLDRHHWYWTGAAWIALLAERDETWARNVALQGPVVALRQAGYGSISPDSVVRIAGVASVLDRQRGVARTIVAIRAADQAATDRAFFSRAGVPVRLYVDFSSVTFSKVGGNNSSYVDYRFDQGRNPVSLRGAYRDSCCPLRLFTVIDLAGRWVTADGVRIPADTAASLSPRRLLIDWPELTLDLERPFVVLRPDSLAVRVDAKR